APGLRPLGVKEAPRGAGLRRGATRHPVFPPPAGGGPGPPPAPPPRRRRGTAGGIARRAGCIAVSCTPLPSIDRPLDPAGNRCRLSSESCPEDPSEIHLSGSGNAVGGRAPTLI